MPRRTREHRSTLAGAAENALSRACKHGSGRGNSLAWRLVQTGQGSATDTTCNCPSVPKPVRGVHADAALPDDILR